jgi:hypothetical protein
MSRMSRPALGPNQPSIQWVLGVLMEEGGTVKWLGYGIDRSLPSSV